MPQTNDNLRGQVLNPVAVRPFTGGVAAIAQSDQIVERVRLFVPFSAEQSEWSDVVNVEFPAGHFSGVAAVSTGRVALEHSASRRSPRRTVVGLVSALPEDAFVTGTVTRVGDRLTRSRAVNAAMGVARFDEERISALGARLARSRSLPRLLRSEFRMRRSSLVDRKPFSVAIERTETTATSGAGPIRRAADLADCVWSGSRIVGAGRARDRAIGTRHRSEVLEHLAAMRTGRLCLFGGVRPACARTVNARRGHVKTERFTAPWTDRTGALAGVGSSSDSHKPNYIPFGRM